MYIEGDISPLEMIASSKNLGDFVDKQEYRDRIKDNISDTMDEIERLKVQLSDQRKEVTSIINDQKSLRGTLSVKNQEANSKLASVNLDKAGFDTKVATETKDIAKLQKEVQQMEAELARLSRPRMCWSTIRARGAKWRPWRMNWGTRFMPCWRHITARSHSIHHFRLRRQRPLLRKWF